MGRFDGQTAIVSGAVQGIGEATALRLAADGANVVIADIQTDESTKKQIQGAGGSVLQVEMDVTKRPDWERTVKAAIEEFGRVDFLANVVGIVNLITEDSVVALSDEAWDNVMDTDLRSVWLGMQAVIPHFQENGGGKIVNLSSLAALKGMTNLASYSAAKGGVIALTQQAALTYAPDNILINAICPGTINTPVMAQITPEMKKQNENSHMIKRLGKPSEIAGMVAYLFSEDGDFATGLSYPVDGGWSTNGRNY